MSEKANNNKNSPDDNDDTIDKIWISKFTLCLYPVIHEQKYREEFIKERMSISRLFYYLLTFYYLILSVAKIIREELSVIVIIILVFCILYLLLSLLFLRKDKYYTMCFNSKYGSSIMIIVTLVLYFFVRVSHPSRTTSDAAFLLIADVGIGIMLCTSFIQIIILHILVFIMHLFFRIIDQDFDVNNIEHINQIFEFVSLTVFSLILSYASLKYYKGQYLYFKELQQKKILLNVELESLPFLLRVAANDGTVKDATLGCIIDPKDLLNTEKINETMSKAEWRRTPVCIKILTTTNGQEVLGTLHDQAARIAQLRHPNLVYFMGFTIYPPSLVYEFIEKGTLYKALYTDKVDFDWTLIVKIAQEIAEGMLYLHEQSPPIVHGSLASSNIFLTNDYHVKIGDIGWSSINNNEEVAIGRFTHRDNLTAWMAPELIMGMQETVNSDSYSYGILLYELVYRKVPFLHSTPNEITEMVLKGVRPDGDKETEVVEPLVPLVYIMRDCWRVKPHTRLPFDEVLDRIKQFIQDEFEIDSNQDWSEFITYPQTKLSIPGLNLNIDELSIGPPIASTSYSKVYEGVYSGTHVSVKVIFCHLSSVALSQFIKESSIMKQLRHPNIVLFIGSTANPQKLYIVTELMPRGSINQIYSNLQRDENIKEHIKLAVKLALDGAKGMEYLHSLDPPLLHRDLKSTNVYVNIYWQAKIADFGLSCFYDNKRILSQCGSPLWVAPEILKGLRYNEKCDVYSYGIILWEIMAWSEPYPNQDPFTVMNLVSENKIKPDPIDYSPKQYTQLYERMLSFDPNSRPSFTEIVSELHKILDDISDKKVEDLTEF